MISKEIEAFIKNTLSDYSDDYNRINKDDKIDFNLSITEHVVEETEDMNESAKKYLGQKMYYLRLAKIYLFDVEEAEKRVIFVAYRPAKDFKSKEEAKKSMLIECLKAMVIGGIEYSEAIREMEKKRQEEDQKDEA